MILLAKKGSICPPSLIRPIALIDSFLKAGERLFLSRFHGVIYRRGLLPDNQSGFRDGFRLQTRLLLFVEDIYSLTANSAPVCLPSLLIFALHFTNFGMRVVWTNQRD